MSMGGAAHLACGEVAELLRAAPPPACWIGESEARRLAAITTERRRAQFLAARWQARWLLAQVLGGAPASWVLEAPQDAPPRVASRSDLLLSISHSGGRCACVLAGEPQGIDLEQPQRRRDIAGLLGLCCTPGERALLTGRDEGGREALFYALWTVKEAWLKKRGEWIAPQRLVQIEAGLDPQGGVLAWRADDWHLAVTATDVRWWTPEPARAGCWRVEDLNTVRASSPPGSAASPPAPSAAPRRTSAP